MNEIAQNTVLISGGAGSMGLLVSDYINSRDDFTLTAIHDPNYNCLLYTSPSPRDLSTSRMPSSA